MKMPVLLQDLVAEIVHQHPDARLELEPLPSGVCFLWVTVNGRNFVLEHSPGGETGVSENLPQTPPFVGHDRAFPSLETAAQEFKTLLTDACRSGSEAWDRQAVPA